MSPTDMVLRLAVIFMHWAVRYVAKLLVKSAPKGVCLLVSVLSEIHGNSTTAKVLQDRDNGSGRHVLKHDT